MATIAKTQGTEILTHAAVTHPGSVYGSTQDVSTKLAATLFMYAGFIEAAANTNPGSFIVQASASSSGDEDWVDVATFTIGETGTPASEALTATEPSGETVLAVAATAGFAALDDIYILDAGTLANSEWAKIEQIVANVSVDITDGLTTGKDSADSIFGSAERFSMYLDLAAIGRLRVIFMHEGAVGANMHVKAMMITGDSIG